MSTEEQAAPAVKDQLPHLTAAEAHHNKIDGQSAFGQVVTDLRRKKADAGFKMGAKYYRALAQRFRSSEDGASGKPRGCGQPP